jgi:hypothetical protein
MHLIFKETSSDFVGILGGLPWIKSEAEWQKSGDSFMVPLLTIFPNIMGDPFDSKYCITVFIDYGLDRNGCPKSSISEKYTINTQDEFDKMKENHTKVVFTENIGKPYEKQLSKEILPVLYIEKKPYTSEEIDMDIEAFEENGQGLEGSSFLSAPYFEQEEIRFSQKYDIFLQIDEWDIQNYSNKLKGIFQTGIGYLYYEKGYKKKKVGEEIGKFFIQHT